MRTIRLAVCIVFFPIICFSQPYANWRNYLNADCITSSVQYNNCIWSGGYGGISILDLATGTITYLDKLNSFLPSNIINDLEVNGNDLWIATQNGLVRYNNSTVTTYWSSQVFDPTTAFYSIALDSPNIL